MAETGMIDSNAKAQNAISVNMQITRVKWFARNKFAMVWGYVGDYEVALPFDGSDQRIQHFRAKKRSPGKSRK